MHRPKLIASIVLAVLALIIILQNTETIEVQFLFFSFSMPLAILLLFAILVGFALGVLVSYIMLKGTRSRYKGQVPGKSL